MKFEDGVNQYLNAGDRSTIIRGNDLLQYRMCS